MRDDLKPYICVCRHSIDVHFPARSSNGTGAVFLVFHRCQVKTCRCEHFRSLERHGNDPAVEPLGAGGVPVVRSGNNHVSKDTPRTSYGNLRKRILGAA